MPSARASAGRSPCTTAMPRGDATRGHAELQRGHPAARAHDAGQLAHRRRRIVDVSAAVGERQRIEARVLERQALSLPLEELHTRASPRKRARAVASICGLWSRPTTVQSARARSSAATIPVPVATSRIRSPACGATASTSARRQRGSARSSAPRSAGRSDAAARGTARAPPASSPTPCPHRTWPCGSPRLAPA